MAAALGALVLAGCGGGVGGGTATQPSPSPGTGAATPGGGGTPRPGGAGTPSPAAPTTLPFEALPTPRFGAKARFLTLRGVVQPGVEAGCLLLSAPQGMFVIVGPAESRLRAGMEVELFGAADDTRLTTCQQGQPFIVTEIRTARSRAA
jgi:hypothetical protein